MIVKDGAGSSQANDATQGEPLHAVPTITSGENSFSEDQAMKKRRNITPQSDKKSSADTSSLRKQLVDAAQEQGTKENKPIVISSDPAEPHPAPVSVEMM